MVILVLTFGSEVWCLSENDLEGIHSFQRFAGRRVQCFPHRTPKHSSFYGLGWIKLTTYIAIKKLLFALFIIRLEANNVIRRVFVNSFEAFSRNREACRANDFHSPVNDICNVCEKYGVFFWLLGRNIPDLSDIDHLALRRTAGIRIRRIYLKAVQSRSGIGLTV